MTAWRVTQIALLTLMVSTVIVVVGFLINDIRAGTWRDDEGDE